MQREGRDWVIVLIAVVGAIVLGCCVFGTIIAAILFPVFQQARLKARQAICLSNQRQVALALMQYITDYNETFPAANRWTDAIDPYTRNRQILVCPEAPNLPCGYAFYRPLGGKKLKQITKPFQTPMLYDSSLGQFNATDNGQSLAARHFGGAGIGFADGHVKWFTESVARSLFRPPP